MTDTHSDDTHSGDTRGDTGDAAEWDTRYSQSDRLWTSNVNPALIAEASELAPGTALDVGSGEGADAGWLADHGWTVTAVDISQVAVDRARAVEPRDNITWLQADLRTDDVPGRDFGLVALSYLPLARSDEQTLRKLLDAVGVNGSLLMVAHAPDGIRAHGRNPDDYFQPDDVLAELDHRWRIVTHNTRERGVAAGGGHHTHDVVLHAVRHS